MRIVGALVKLRENSSLACRQLAEKSGYNETVTGLLDVGLGLAGGGSVNKWNCTGNTVTRDLGGRRGGAM